MPVEQWTFKSAQNLAARSAAEQKPAGSCPYVGVLVYPTAEFVRFCKLGTSTCTKTMFADATVWVQCFDKLRHEAYLQSNSAKKDKNTVEGSV